MCRDLNFLCKLKIILLCIMLPISVRPERIGHDGLSIQSIRDNLVYIESLGLIEFYFCTKTRQEKVLTVFSGS